MTERERWIVYPLLFLALGAALRDKLVDRTTTKSIVCQELLVVDEQPLGREPVLLARLGRADGDNGDTPPSGQLLLNGQLDILDRDPSNDLARRLITLGRGTFRQTGTVGGQVLVNGEVAVNGAINATYFVYQGVPIVPALRGVIPGASLPAEVLRMLPGALSPTQTPNAPDGAPPSGPSQPTRPVPPATGEQQDAKTGQQPQASPEDGKSSGLQPPEATPLAEPAPNR